MSKYKEYKHTLLSAETKKELELFRIQNELKSSDMAIKKLLEVARNGYNGSNN